MAFLRRTVALLLPIVAIAGCTSPEMRLAPTPVYVQGDLGDHYPVRVERQTASLALPGALGAEELTADEEARLDGLIRDYWTDARGPLSIAVPRTEKGETRALDRAQQIADHAQWRGLGETEVVMTVDTTVSGTDSQIVVSYPFYVARLPSCGDWSKENSHDSTNTAFSNFGCATQRNFGTMIADPADMLAARQEGLRDTIRSNLVVQQYRAGKTTISERATAEKAQISTVGGQ